MRTLKYFIPILTVTACIGTSCKKMDAKYKEFIVPNGITYTGKVNSPVASSGRNRVKITWRKVIDPSVVKAKIFWNNYTDSLEVPISKGKDPTNVLINNLLEKPYVFNIKTYDSKGHSSVPVELLCKVYGDKYQAGLLNRPVLQSILYGQANVTTNWGAANISGGAYVTEIKYTNNSDQIKLLRLKTTESKSEISDLKPLTSFQYSTLYLPDSLSIDTFRTVFKKNKEFIFDKKTWQIVAYSSQNSTNPGDVATNFIDGNPATRWLTSGSSSHYPHFITIDMKTKKLITAFEIFRWNGDVRGCNTFQILVSKDNITWTDLGTFDFNRLTDGGQLYPIASTPEARYFKFVGLSGPQQYMVMGEINVYGL